MIPYIIQSLLLILVLLILMKKSLKDYDANNINYICFQLGYFLIKVFVSGVIVFMFCLFYSTIKQGLIINGMIVFLLIHFIEAYVYNKLIFNERKINK